MVVWVLKLLAHLGHKHPDFFLSPRRRGTELGEQPHAPALHPGKPVLEIDGTSFLQILISRPGPNGPLVVLLVDIHEPGFAEAVCHRVDDFALAARANSAVVNHWTPGAENAIGRECTVIALDVCKGL